jgi:hypothetical protein
MFLVGDILLTTSKSENMSCAWHLRKGYMMHDEGVEVYDGRNSRRRTCDSFVQLPSWDCPIFVTHAGWLTVFAFVDSSDSQRRMAEFSDTNVSLVEAKRNRKFYERPSFD